MWCRNQDDIPVWDFIYEILQNVAILGERVDPTNLAELIDYWLSQS